MAQPPPVSPRAEELTPRQLADAWKKQGGFDRLRKQLLGDFLQSPEKDALVAELDALLPTLLSTTPSLARTPRQTRVAETASLLDKRGALNAPVLRLENRLQSGKGVGKTVERELKRAMCDAKGLPYVEDPADLLAEKEEVAKIEPSPVRVEPERPSGPRDEATPAIPRPTPSVDVGHEFAMPSSAPTHAIHPSPGPLAPASSSSSTPAAAAVALPPSSAPADAPLAHPVAAERTLNAPSAPHAAQDVEMQDAAAAEPALARGTGA
ncbi:hypothetical protein JCM3775_006487 [Rhodotorula graminis]